MALWCAEKQSIQYPAKQKSKTETTTGHCSPMRLGALLGHRCCLSRGGMVIAWGCHGDAMVFSRGFQSKCVMGSSRDVIYLSNKEALHIGELLSFMLLSTKTNKTVINTESRHRNQRKIGETTPEFGWSDAEKDFTSIR